MHLRVFSGSVGDYKIEISHPTWRREFSWFVPMFPEGDPELIGIGSNSLIALSFNGLRYVVPFRVIQTISLRNSDLQEINQLEEEDSRNILNNIIDILAWD